MNSETLLYRQIHPNWIQDGVCTSLAFQPTPKDENELSVYDGELISAQDSWEFFTSILKLQSAQVLAVENRECESIELATESKPAQSEAHAVIHFDPEWSKSVNKKKARALRNFAIQRGVVFDPTS